MSLVALKNWVVNQQVQARQGQWIIFLVLLLGVMATALAVVFTTYTSRHLLNELQDVVQEQNHLQVEWGRLQLEQSSLVAQGQVEEIAINQLGMEVPSMDKVVVFPGE